MNRELERYITEERESGTSEETIRHALIGKGWEYSEVEVSLTESRPGPATTLFTRAFFRFAFGFMMIIMTSVAIILITGAWSGAQKEETNMAETQK